MLKVLKLLIILFAIFLISATGVRLEDPESIEYHGISWPTPYKFVTGISRHEIDRVLEYHKIERAIYNEIKIRPNHPLLKKPSKRFRMAQSILKGADKGGVNWRVLIAIFTYESAFYTNVVSTDGFYTKGLGQLHGRALTYCFEKEGKIDMSDPDNQAICSAHWIKRAIDECKGELDKGLAMYATGYMCDYSRSKELQFIVRRRIKKIDILSEM